MPKGEVETVYENNRWGNRVEGEAGTIGETFETKEPAVDAGRELARVRRVEHIIKNADGTIGERNSYGHDPRDIKG
jgi:hypothetical protein